MNLISGKIRRISMANAVKKTISLPPDLAQEAEETARLEGKDVKWSYSGRTEADAQGKTEK
jgi:hypothetical protein